MAKKKEKKRKDTDLERAARECVRKDLFLMVDESKQPPVWRMYENQTGREIARWSPTTKSLWLWGVERGPEKDRRWGRIGHWGEFIKAAVIRRSEMRRDGVLPPRPEPG